MSTIKDYRIHSTNIYVETSFGEYLQYAKDLIKNNDLQRKRVKTSKTVYSLLKTDLLNGCVIPPLVLAIIGNDAQLENIKDGAELQMYIETHRNKVLILDGLQRTHTLIAAEIEAIAPKKEHTFYKYILQMIDFSNQEYSDFCILEYYPDTIQILIYDKENTAKIDNFDISNYSVDLFSKGYSFNGKGNVYTSIHDFTTL